MHRAVFALDDLAGGPIAFIVDFADDFLEDVFERHNALNAAVFIDHDRKMTLAVLKSAQQTRQPRGLGHDQCILAQVFPVDGILIVQKQPLEQLLGKDNARRIIDLAGLCKRKSAMTSLANHGERFGACHRAGHEPDLVARQHDVVSAKIAQLRCAHDHAGHAGADDAFTTP